MISNQEWTIRLLQEANLLSDKDRKAAEKSRKNSESIIEALIRTAIISEEQIARTLAVNAAMEYVDLHDFKPPVGLQSLVSREVALKYNIAPLVKTHKALSIVVADPYDFEMLDSLSEILQTKLEYYCSTLPMIKELQVRIYCSTAETIGKRSSEQVDSKTLDSKAMIGGIWTNRPDAFASQWKQVNAGLLDSVNASLAKLRHWQDKQAEHQQALQTLAMEIEQGRLSEAKAISNTLGQVRFAGLNYKPVQDFGALQDACTALAEAKRGAAARKVRELRAQYSKASIQSELGQLLQRHQKCASAEKTKALVLALVLIGLVAGFAKVMEDNHREGLRIVAEAKAESERLAAEAKAKAEAEQKERERLAAEAKAKAEAIKAAFVSSNGGDTITLAPFVEMPVAFIGPGSFTMGSPSSEYGHSSDEGQVDVILSQGFGLAKTEVTQAQWEAVMGSNPSEFKGSNLPVERVGWEDVQAFIAKLNEKQILPQGWKFALPTEAQWEYACRAGEKGPYSGGNLDEVGWYNGNSGSQTHEVAKKRPNALGLYDMHGNVYEWCSDWYEDTLKGGIDPVGPSSSVYRVLRGGSWPYVASACRAAHRRRHAPGNRFNDLGFRPALVPSR